MIGIEDDGHGIALELKAHMLIQHMEKRGQARVIIVGEPLALVGAFPILIVDSGAYALQS